MTNIVGIQTIAHLDEQAVEIIFHGDDKSILSIRLEKRGIFDLRDEIDELLKNCPEIHQWKSGPAH